LREGFASRQHLIGLFTASPREESERAAVEALAQQILAQPLPNGHSVAGFLWFTTDEIAEIAQGDLAQVWGIDALQESLGACHYTLSLRSFFQTSTHGALLLYETLAEALPRQGGTLYDLYCGIGSIGIFLAKHFDTIIGIEENPHAIEDAIKNAAQNNLSNAHYHASKLEDALALLPSQGEDHILLVDPPRVGLHPRAAQAIAQAPGDTLLYVACHPPSLGRDALLLQEGGWTLDALWFVDLFPQTYHIEAIGRFRRHPHLSPNLSQK
jgi:23S rRNA (uracil1939-C5)-methyltransferase